MRFLAVDVGSRRVGLAISNPEQTFALPYEVVDDSDVARSAGKVADIIQREEIARVIVGLPLTLEGKESTSTEAVRRYAEALGARINVPLEFFDERLSTVQAQSSLRAAGVNARKARGRIDAHAATVILQTYLDQNRS